jgi:hypothetical protein
VDIVEASSSSSQCRRSRLAGKRADALVIEIKVRQEKLVMSSG